MNPNLISKIASFAARYRDRFLKESKPRVIASDPRAALDFFFGRACFQGRRDDISRRVYQAVIETLDEHPFSHGARPMEERERSLIESALRERIGKGKVGKSRDVEMVLSTLDYAAKLPKQNIVKYSVEQVSGGRISQHYLELQRASSKGGIIQVGPKIAAFYLRDIVCLYSLEEHVSAEFAFCLQPIDVWVRRLCSKIGIADDKARDDEVRRAIVAACNKYNVPPPLFNQGAWYVGYFAHDIVLELLGAESGAGIDPPRRTAGSTDPEPIGDV